jgi:hypothetical protein
MKKKNIVGLLAIVAIVAVVVVAMFEGCIEKTPISPNQTQPEKTGFIDKLPEVSPTPMPEAKCPISCSADSEGWSLVFECEEEGQMVTTKELEDRVTVWENGKLSHMHAVREYKFETSGNVYQAIIDIVPCEKSATGYCITVEVTGETLGDEPVTCKNF